MHAILIIAATILMFNPAPAKLIALTFDDGPNQELTPQVLDILNQHDAKATFFVTGQAAKAFPKIVKREVLAGHEVGNHTMNHKSLTSLPGKDALWQISEAQ